MLSGISTPLMTTWACRVPCSASGAYADLVGSRSPAGSALERSYPVMPIMLTARPNDIRGLGQIGLAMRRATQDLVAWAAWACRSTTPPYAARGSAGATPTPRPPPPARYCAVPHINIFRNFMVCYTFRGNGG